MTELRESLIRKRYAAERRFRIYGASALVLTAVFLALLLASIISQAVPAFTEKTVILDVVIDPAEADPANPAAGNYDGMVKAALKQVLPDARNRAERKALNGLLSSGAGDELRRMVIADPALIGQTVTLPVLLSADATLYLKGLQARVAVSAGAAPVAIAPAEGGEGLILTGPGVSTEPGLSPGQIVMSGSAALRITAVESGTASAEALTPIDASLSALTPGNWKTLSFSAPEADRRTSDLQATWLEQLKDAGRIETGFAWRFFTAGDSREPELAGIRGALVGSLLTVAVALALALPLGVAAAIYLEQFAPKNRLTDLIEVNINNLAAVPSIIFGLLGLAVFLNFFGMPRSAPVVGGLVLALLVLPTIIIASRAALKAVPPSITEAALGVGASHQQAVFHHVLPLALPGIMTGTILGLARAFGETAPLLMIGMVAFIADVPHGFTDAATVLPVQVFLWSDLPELAFKNKTAAAIIVLLAVLFVLNAAAIYLRRRFERRW